MEPVTAVTQIPSVAVTTWSVPLLVEEEEEEEENEKKEGEEKTE